MSKKRIKGFMTIMDSMTQEELDGDDKLFTDASGPTRIRRIARGSGLPVVAIHELIRTFVPFRKLFANMKGMGGMLGGKPGNLASMMGRDGMKSMQKMAGALDPRMLQKVGGVGGLQNMMKQFAMAEKKGQLPKGLAGLKGLGGLF